MMMLHGNDNDDAEGGNHTAEAERTGGRARVVAVSARGPVLNGVASLLVRPHAHAYAQVWMDGGHYAPLDSPQPTDGRTDGRTEADEL